MTADSFTHAEQAIDQAIEGPPAAQLPAIAQPAPEYQPPAEVDRWHAPPPSLPWLDPARHALIEAYARQMANARLLPDSLRTKKTGSQIAERTADEIFGTCFLITNQAVLWRMDPFAVAQCMSMVHGRLGYEGKLIAAVVESLSGVRFEYEWFGTDGPIEAMGVICRGVRPGETIPREVRGTVGDWQTKAKRGGDDDNSGNAASAGNVSAMWRGRQAQTQLVYRATREWARVWMPGVIFGITSIDEIEALDPPPAALPANEAPQKVSAGFGDRAPRAQGSRSGAGRGQGPSKAAGDASAAVGQDGEAPTPELIGGALKIAKDWNGVKMLLPGIFKKFGPEHHEMIRRAAWDVLGDMRVAGTGPEPFDLRTDLIAFRCFVAAATDQRGLDVTWQGVKAGAAFKGLPAKDQDSIAEAVAQRISALKMKPATP